MDRSNDVPFLSVMTRTYKRPKRLEKCKASLAKLTDPDYEHVVVRDEVGVGHDGSYQLCIDAYDQGRVNGRYVWFLDDDDELARPDFITQLKAVAEDNPSVIVVRHKSAVRIWPEDKFWEQPPHRGHIGNGCMITRSDVWRMYAHLLTIHHYAGDIFMIRKMYHDGLPFRWLDIIGTLKSAPGVALTDEELDAR